MKEGYWVTGLCDKTKILTFTDTFLSRTNILTPRSTKGSWNLYLQRVESHHLLLRDCPCITWYGIDIQLIQSIGVHWRIYYEVRFKFICCCITKWFYHWQDVRENPFGIHSRVARVLVAVYEVVVDVVVTLKWLILKLFRIFVKYFNNLEFM